LAPLEIGAPSLALLHDQIGKPGRKRKGSTVFNLEAGTAGSTEMKELRFDRENVRFRVTIAAGESNCKTHFS
jgi:hypothetical protein